MRDDLLIEIARRGPTHPDELHALRGLPRGQEEAILEAIRRAKSLPLGECPEPEARDNDPPNVALMASLLNVVLNDYCGRNRLASNLVASNSDLKAVARSRAFAADLPDVPLCRGWRSRSVLPELLALLSGETAIRVADPRASDPLELVELEPEGDEEEGEGAEDRPEEGSPSSREEYGTL
jgi:ribonuclease D